LNIINFIIFEYLAKGGFGVTPSKVILIDFITDETN